MHQPFSSSVRARLRRTARWLALIASAAIAGPALAQGGPPMVTDDPETPGDGHWEVNLGAIATRTHGRLEVAAPDADINYGWGDHIQLKADIPWTFVRDDGQRWKSGLGTGNFGVKWRFIDQEQAGFSVSTYPQYSHSMLDGSTRRGIASDGHEFFLPLELATDVGGFGVSTEVGRNFVSGGGDSQWIAGIVAGHACGEGRECIAEVRRTQAPGVHHTLLNLGMHWKINDTYTLLGAVGREFGAPAEDGQQLLVYLGLQITR
ncbi:hypothetical protein OR214_03499 [Ralstonia pickettii OR214]|uniref:Transporter n=2 Tax=Burkholderiaceae TaxID=119060 RepID=R0CJU3_RALPI|nr:hypothetical protein OR214_03499 [Ralstonia pickettii OR214]